MSPGTRRRVFELIAPDFVKSLNFYTQATGFSQPYGRPGESSACLDHDGAELKIVECSVAAKRDWAAEKRSCPYGWGINLAIEVEDIDALHAPCARNGDGIFLEMEEKC